jgi:hypothetical protein
LAAGYHFSEGRGTKVADFSGNGNDGQLMDGKTWGRVGAALQKTPPADASATLHFDERRGTTVHDFSGNGKDGTLHGGVEWASDNGDRDRKDKQTTLTDLSRQFSVASRHPQKGG